MKKIVLTLLAIVGLWMLCSFTGTYNGIDISHHNDVCWKCIAENPNIEFCYIKATEGKGMKDPKCKEYNKAAKQIGLSVGLYHYFRTNVSAEDQFKNFKSVYNSIDSDLIPVIDVEDKGNDYSNSSLVNKRLSKLIELFYQEYKVYPIIYMGSFNACKTYSSIYKCPLWIRTLNWSNYVPNFAIKQVDVNRVGDNYIDLNYCSNIKKLKMNSSL